MCMGSCNDCCGSFCIGLYADWKLGEMWFRVKTSRQKGTTLVSKYVLCGHPKSGHSRLNIKFDNMRGEGAYHLYLNPKKQQKLRLMKNLSR